MPAPLSIVIPTLNAAGQLPDTIACLMEGLESGVLHDLVITDADSTDATRQIAEDLGATFVVGLAGRGGQLRRGAMAAQGEWLLFLHADTHLAPGWVSVAGEHIRHATGAGYFRLAFRAPGLAARLFAGGANLRARLGLPYGDQGLLISRELYDEVGGYRDIALMEDVAMARALRGQLVALNATASTSAERYLRGGWIRRGARNVWTLVRYLCGADPDRLARSYNR